MLTVICYDIPDNKRRLKVAQTLLDYGFRIQKSVFEAHLNDAELATLRQRLEGIIDAAVDSVRLYRLCAGCDDRIVTLGQAVLTEVSDVIII